MNPLIALTQHGQAVWLDAISRSLIRDGAVQRLIDEDGLTGVTSNPTIFAKALADSSDYDEAVRRVLALNSMAANEVLAERLMVEDIQMAAELLHPVYHRTDGADGFVSLEVSPGVAHDTAATVAQARRLWFEVARPNVMIKVPATSESLPAIEMLIAQGINVNITLMFSLEHYDAVAHAYLRGLAGHADPGCVASVASVFVSRLDTMADRQLEAIGSPEALALRGRVAIANAQRIYQRFDELFHGDAFEELARRGARVQRPLWASTGTKNPAYSDVIYLEALIGRDTVTTVPPATLDAFREHGRVGASLDGTAHSADATLAAAARLGVDVHALTEQLQNDGIDAFAASFAQLLTTVDDKRRALAAVTH